MQWRDIVGRTHRWESLTRATGVQVMVLINLCDTAKHKELTVRGELLISLL